jgi:transposase
MKNRNLLTPREASGLWTTRHCPRGLSRGRLGCDLFRLNLYADGGYQGAQFQDALRTILKRGNVEIVKRSDQAQRFVVLPKRWIVERTFAWLGRCRRLAKDWEGLNRQALAFLKLASIRLMTRKLCNSRGSSRTDSQTRGAIHRNPDQRASADDCR